MSEIDWSKAPADATHATHDNGMTLFYKVESNAPMVWYGTFDSDGIYRLCWRISNTFRSVGAMIDKGAVARPSSTPEWSGEGLPPVGCRCEAAIPHTSGNDDQKHTIWIEGTVLAHHEIKGKTFTWFAEDDGFYPPNVLEFRPIRTPEQIAAEQRQKAVDELVKRFALHDVQYVDWRVLFGQMYDAGYRKQEPSQ